VWISLIQTIWYDKDAEAAARFYAETFPDSSVSAVHHAPSDYPSGKAGDVRRRQESPFAAKNYLIAP
jgi:predicted 3-demethylubiquinone-9 3-methyltransferase (glyoxalase superfamily)